MCLEFVALVLLSIGAGVSGVIFVFRQDIIAAIARGRWYEEDDTNLNQPRSAVYTGLGIGLLIACYVLVSIAAIVFGEGFGPAR